MAAVRAGHRGIFDDGDGRIGRPQHLVAERACLHELGKRHLAAGGLRHRGVRPAPKVIAGTAGRDDGHRGDADEQLAARGGRSGLVGLAVLVMACLNPYD